MNWTIYDEATGAILRSGQSHDAQDAYEQMAAHESIIIGEAYRDDLYRIVDGQAVEREPTDEELDAKRSQVLAEIDAGAGFARSRYITTADGQDYIYAAKLAEARRVLGGATDAPLLSAEAEFEGVALSDKAAQVIERAEATATALAAIEVAKMAAKLAVKRAKTKTDMESAAQINWP